MTRLGLNQQKFEVNDRVFFDLGGGLSGAGTVLGQAQTGLLDVWIVMLDRRLPEHLAITVPSPQLRLLEER